jgi:hypothetical protein
VEREPLGQGADRDGGRRPAELAVDPEPGVLSERSGRLVQPVETVRRHRPMIDPSFFRLGVQGPVLAYEAAEGDRGFTKRPRPW